MSIGTVDHASTTPDTIDGTGTGAGTGTPRRTPGRRRPLRRTLLWSVVVLVAVALAVSSALVGGGSGQQTTPLDPTSTAQDGSRAVVEVLRQRGTRVDVVRTAAAARGDATRGGTVLVDDSAGLLGRGAARGFARTAPRVVLVTASAAALDGFGIRAEALPSGPAPSSTTADTSTCAIAAAAAARSVSTGGTAYRVDAGTRCAPSDGGGGARGWGLVRTTTPAGEVTLLGTTAALRNDTVTDAGNAALVLGLLGADDHLTWYVPTAGDAGTAPTLGRVAPPWVPSALVLLAAVAVAAGVWRGRRLGPLVVERLPVVVRAAETTEGRARLARRTGDRTHALDTIRVAAIRRTARSLGLPRSAHVDDVVRAAARAAGLPARDVGAALVGGPATTDAALVAGAEAVRAVETAVRRAAGGADDARRASRPPTGSGLPDRTGDPVRPRPGSTGLRTHDDQPDQPRPGGRP